MSKRHRNKTEQGTTAAIASQMEIVSNVTSIRRSPNTNAHPSSLPLHMEQIVRRRAYDLYEQRGQATIVKECQPTARSSGPDDMDSNSCSLLSV